MNDHIRNLGIASIAAVPLIGGSIAYLLDKKIPSNIQEQYLSFVCELEESIKDLEDKLDYSRIETPEFYSLFQKILNEVISSQMTIKRELFKNMIINSITPDWKWDKTDYFLHIVLNISDDELEELYLFYIKGEQDSMVSRLAKQFPEYRDYIISFTSEVSRFRLVDGNKLSPLGYEFCDYVFRPIMSQILLRN